MADLNFVQSYNNHVADLARRIQGDDALRLAIGGEFMAVGKLEYYLLRSLGLEDGQSLVDIGCGSGRLATQLVPMANLRYLGTDVVQPLLDLASRLCGRSDWRFERVDTTAIPQADASAEMVCSFSVFTHLLHEETFKYLREAMRVLKPGGLLVFSFIEFRIPCHWGIFMASVDAHAGWHLNQFMDRDGIRAWAENLGFEIVSIHDGDKPHIPIPEEIVWENGNRMSGMGNIGQSIAILRKPTAVASPVSG